MKTYVTNSLALFIFVMALSNESPAADRESCELPEARWLFDGSGTDETGNHHAQIEGGSFIPTRNGFGLLTRDAGSRATYSSISQLVSGEIAFAFHLDAVFEHDERFTDAIIFINSNRPGHLEGDFSIRLDPHDGRVWFVQEDPVVSTDWLLKSTRNRWDAGIWYQVRVRWGSWGRDLEVTWEGGSDSASDSFARPCFSSGATARTIGARAGYAPEIGLTIDCLEVCHEELGPEVSEVSWAQIKSRYREVLGVTL